MKPWKLLMDWLQIFWDKDFWSYFGKTFADIKHEKVMTLKEKLTDFQKKNKLSWD